MTTNYLHEIDLNPAIGGPINNPYDPRADHNWCFEANSQEVILVFPPQQPVTTPYRVFVSYDCGHYPLIFPGAGPLPQPPPGVGPQVHGVLAFDPAFGIGMQPEERRVFRRTCCHLARSLKVWLDPNSPQPPTAQPIVVQVSASARGGDACCAK